MNRHILKKGVQAGVAMCVCLSMLLTGCGKKANLNSDAKTTISYTGYWCYSDYEDGSFVETMIEDALGIEINVVKAETSDTIDLLLASGEMPDCMWSDSKTADWMYDQELARTIPKSMVAEYCPKLLEYYDEYPLIWGMTLNPNNEDEFLYLTGVTYQFIDYYLPGDFYRYDWIENLGIDLGVNVEQVADNLYVADDGIELSKFIEIMDGFVNGDPDQDGKNNTVGVTAPELSMGQFFSAYGFSLGINEAPDGSAQMHYALDTYKDFLKGFAELYARNLIDPEIINRDRTLSWDKVNSGVAGYWITSTNALNSWAIDRPPLTLMERDPSAKILVTPGIKPDGGTVQAITNSSPAYGRFYVNANVDDEKLVEILKFLNYTLFGDGNPDTQASMIFGEKGIDWEWNEAGDMPIQINQLNSQDKGTWTFSQFGQTKDVAKWTGEEDLFNAGAKYWSASSNGIWMQWQHTYYKQDIANETEYGDIQQKISSDLDAYVANYLTQAVLGQIDIDSTWDGHLKKLDSLGYNKMMAELDKIDSLKDMQVKYSK